MLRRQLLLDRIRTAAFAVCLAVPAGLLLFAAYRSPGGPTPFAVYLISAMLVVFSIAQTVRCAVLLTRPESQWIGKCLRQIDERPWDLAQTIDDQWRADGVVVEGVVPGFHSWMRPDTWFTVLTADWLIHVSLGRIVILMPDKICWIYRKITASKFTLVGPRYRHAVSCRMADGKTEFDVSAKTEPIALWLAADLVNRRPNVLTGYQGDWVELGITNPPMLAWRAEQRRWEFEALSRAEQALWVDDAVDDLDEFPRRVDPNLPETMK